MRRFTAAVLALTISAAGMLAATPVAFAQETQWKVAMLADVGSLNDRNFNEYTQVGTNAAAEALGLPMPAAVVPKDDSEYGTLLQGLIDAGNNIIVTTGFNLGVETTKAAKANPDVWFIGVDQAPICVTPEGVPDDTFACAGDAPTLLPNYVAIGYAEDQAGYLAGMAAAGASENGRIGAIGGVTFCAPCVRYIQGYQRGAKAVNPDIEVYSAWVTDSDINKAFYDQPGGKLFAQQFIELNQPDVLFQVAGQTGNGVLDAACDAGILAVGVDVDQYLSYPAADPCILTSAEKHLANTVEATIRSVADGTAVGGDLRFDASNDGIGIADFRDKADLVPDDVKAQIDEALAQMQAGTLETCPANCGSLLEGNALE
jgi:basic membrane protein A